MKILTMGDSAHTISGFGTALRSLDSHLHKVGHEVYHIGWQHFGQEIIASFHDKILGYVELPNIGGHQFGEKALQYWLPKINPDVLITLADFWMIQHIFKTDMPWPHCFPAGTPIYMKGGQIEDIENVELGDITLSGGDVINIMCRPYSGEFIVFDPMYCPKFKATPEHPISVAELGWCHWKSHERRRCRPDCVFRKRGDCKKQLNLEPIWKNAEDITDGDFLIFPKYVTPVYDTVPELNIPITKELMEIAGWYLAEGHCGGDKKTKYSVVFSLGKDEHKVALRLAKLFKKIFNLDAHMRRNKSVINVAFYKKKLSEFFDKNFGRGATNKQIPQWIIDSSPDMIRVFLDAYRDGDGMLGKRRNLYVTYSKKIAHQLLLLGNKIGTLFHITISNVKTNYSAENTSIRYDVREEKRNRYSFSYNGNYYIPIKNIKRELNNCLVYNLETVNNVYQIPIKVHNCHWYPVDGYPITDQMKEMLRRIDYRVCLSKYGADLVKAEGISTSHIPHGIDTSVFKPLPDHDKLEMKKRLGIPPGVTVIGRVDRNQSRKKIPRTMKAFTKLHAEFPNTVLLLWMDKVDREGWDLEFCAKRLGLQQGKDIFFPPPDMMANFMYGTSTETLVEVMNTMDIHCYLTGGEGFGLAQLETASCGVVNVCTDYTTPKEIQGDWTCGLPVRVETFEMGNAGVDRAFADVDHAYAQMKYLIENPDERKIRSERGVERARKVYDINIVTRQFDQYLRENIGQLSDRERDLICEK